MSCSFKQQQAPSYGNQRSAYKQHNSKQGQLYWYWLYLQDLGHTNAIGRYSRTWKPSIPQS